jgi:hypothetical protein
MHDPSERQSGDRECLRLLPVEKSGFAATLSCCAFCRRDGRLEIVESVRGDRDEAGEPHVGMTGDQGALSRKNVGVLLLRREVGDLADPGVLLGVSEVLDLLLTDGPKCLSGA